MCVIIVTTYLLPSAASEVAYDVIKFVIARLQNQH